MVLIRLCREWNFDLHGMCSIRPICILISSSIRKINNVNYDEYRNPRDNAHNWYFSPLPFAHVNARKITIVLIHEACLLFQIDELNAQLSAAQGDIAEKQAMIESLLKRKKQLEAECDKMDDFEEEMNDKVAAYCAEIEKLKVISVLHPSSRTVRCSRCVGHSNLSYFC